MSEGLTIELFCDSIQDFYGEFKSSEKVIEGINREFKHLNEKELHELWFFIKERTGELNYPSAAKIKKLAKEYHFKIREQLANKRKSYFVCGMCGYENELIKKSCKECGHNLSDLPTKCSKCGEKYYDPKYEELKKMRRNKSILNAIRLKCPKCSHPRQRGSILRKII